ncbi:MAG: methylisocitrate lyase [Thermoprotei archaeon]
MNGAFKLRKLIASKQVVMAPGVFNPISAVIAQSKGFKALYFSGGGLANTLALPDLGVTTLSEVVQSVQAITSVVDLPLIVDIDTGFGEVFNVERAVRELERVGASAVHIEDQVMPKRCGHLEGKELVDAEEMVKKIVAAKGARRENIVIIARTDAKGVEGFDAAVERAKIYIKAGADMIFPEALESEDEFREFAKKIKAPLLANMTEFGKTPYISAQAFGEMGYKVVIFPMTALRAALKAVSDAMTVLAQKGSQKEFLEHLMTRAEVYRLISYSSYEERDKALSEAASNIIGG